MGTRAEAQAAINGLAAKQGQAGSITPTTLANERLQALLDASVTGDQIDLADRYFIKPVDGGVGSRPEALGLYENVSGVEILVGAIADTFTDSVVFNKALGGVRFFNEADGFEYFLSRRDVSGNGLGVTFGNPDGAGFISVSQDDGLSVYHQTQILTSQQLGNNASTNYIESDTFTFQVTSTEVRPYGILVLSFTGETDVDFTDVPFDTRILDSTGAVVYSDIQDSALWDVEPQPAGNPRFTLSSNAGEVVLPASQPFPMDSGTTYTVEYRFKQNIRLKGDAQPALLMQGRRLEYYPINYTSEVGVEDSTFTVISGGEYIVDTTNNPINAIVHPTVKSATFGDFDNTWTNTNSLTVITDQGNIVFNNNEQGKKYQIVKNGSQWRVYNADGSLHDTVGAP